jgi:hypothetical protein
MAISFSDPEAAILLGATLMHWGVPFHRAVKRELNDKEQATVDAASAKLIALRERCPGPLGQGAESIPFSDEELSVLIEVVEDCLAECGNDATELHIQLKTSARQEAEALLGRLRHSLAPGGTVGAGR